MSHRLLKALRVLLCGLATTAGAQTPTVSRTQDRDALQGTWRVIDARARMSNEPAMIIDGLVDRGTVEFRGDTVILRQLGSGDRAVYIFNLDTARRPRQIRLVDPTAADSGRWTGLYRVASDTLRLSLPIEHFSNRPVPPADFNAPNTAAYILTRVEVRPFTPPNR
jgi:uncharacterized protein (TIGR03067 family)